MEGKRHKKRDRDTPAKASHQTARVCNETEEVASARNSVTKPTNVDLTPVETGSGGPLFPHSERAICLRLVG